MKQFKVNILDCLLVRFGEWRGMIAVLLTVSKNINMGIQLDIYKSISFKPGMMIDTIIACILISVLLSLALIQVTGV